MQRAIDDYLASHAIDLVNVEFAQMGYYALPRDKPSVLTEHNVEYDILYRTYQRDRLSLRKLYNLMEWRKFRRDELAICRKFDMCMTTSERDKEVLAAQLPTTRFAVIPNGVDSTFYSYEPEAASEQSLLFTGTIDYHPNTDGLKYFLEEVLPIVRRDVADIRFYIVGKDPPPEILRYGADPGIIITGAVDDVRDYFRKATIVVVPLRVGGGTRLKILEAMAMGKPVVSSTAGAEGLAVTEGEHILLADKPAAMARAIVTLMRDAELRTKLAVNGRRLIEQRYDWRLIARELERAYDTLLHKEISL
jgi:glycosyltransferase involved in cell wall biosynthesis